MPTYIQEAWVHLKYPERKPTDEIHHVLKTLFYTTRDVPATRTARTENHRDTEDNKELHKENDDNNNDNEEVELDSLHIPMGFDKFLLRVRARTKGTRYQSRISIGECLWFYNRQTLTQVFYRFPRGGGGGRVSSKTTDAVASSSAQFRTSLPRKRPTDPYAEVQADILHITTPGDKEARRVLVCVDVATRYIWAYPVSQNAAQFSEATGRAFASAIPIDIRERIQRLVTDNGGEFQGKFFTNAMEGIRRPMTVHTLYSKASTLQAHPGILSPVEVAVRTVREYLEKYRRLVNPANFFRPKDFQRIAQTYNETPHKSFKNRHSPEELVDPNKQKLLKDLVETRYTYLKTKHDKATEAHPTLEKNELVRIQRVRGAFTKQSAPSLTYDLYRVTAIHPPLITVLNHSRPSRPGADVHISRIVRVKLPAEDPPPYTKFKEFVARLTHEMDADKDYFLAANNKRNIREETNENDNNSDNEEVDIPLKEVLPPRRSSRKRTRPERYAEEHY